MQRNRFARVLAAATIGAAASFALAGPAAAGDTVDINPGNVPTTAADAERECSPKLGGGPYPGKDVWVFNLPAAGRNGAPAAFVTITATFSTPAGGTEVVVIEAGADDGDDIVHLGHSKAYAITAAGWTLTGASATITGSATRFVLTHTCPAAGKPSPSEEASPSPEPSGGTEGSPSPGPSVTEPPAATPSASPAAPGGPGEPGTGGGLPVTGVALGGVVLAGAALVAGGTALRMVRRRRFTA